jgi:hypothetical protein
MKRAILENTVRLLIGVIGLEVEFSVNATLPFWRAGAALASLVK